MGNTAKENNCAFVYYKLPGEENIFFLSGEVMQVSSETKTGFIIQPFDGNKKPLIIQGEGKIIDLPDNPKIEFLYHSAQIPDDKTSEHYCQLVAKGLDAITKEVFSKVVLSRSKKVNLPDSFSPLDFFVKITRAYPDAFVYLLSTPQYGTWLGASPETLIRSNGKSLKTMAMAGTVLNGGHFTQKEKTEQQPVTDYIVATLCRFAKNLTIQQPSPKKAGNVEHIVTEISAEYDGDILEVLNALHPTPAVGGLPKEEAIKFIHDNEGYDRSLYSGYLGPISNDKANIFVNLRCMQLFDSEAVLYAGAGIVNGSVPEKEWQETENKMNTLLTHIK